MSRMKGQGSKASWPDIHLDTLKRMWAEGATGGAIAKVIPYSRCAVCAMARRQNLPPRPRVCVPRTPRQPKASPPVLVLPTASRRERGNLFVRLIAEESRPVREAAQMAGVEIREARSYVGWLRETYDMGEPAAMNDDVERPVHA